MDEPLDADAISSFIIPKVCIKKEMSDSPVARKRKIVAPPPQQPAVQLPTYAGSATGTPVKASQIGDRASGLKLVLRVPKDSEPTETGTSGLGVYEQYASTQAADVSEDMKLEEENDGNSSGASNGAEQRPDGAVSSDTEITDTPDADGSKKKRRKKRFRLSKQPQKIKTKLWRELTGVLSPRAKRLEAKKAEIKNEELRIAAEQKAAAEKAAEQAVVDELRLRSPSPNTYADFTPLQILLDYLLRGFLRKDPDHYFTYPVTEDIAPNYSRIISHPMDFSTIRQKIDENTYRTLLEFKKDVELISSNAMTYNEKNTIYYVAAKKLKVVAEYMFSAEKLNATRKIVPVTSRLTKEQLGFSAHSDAVSEKRKACLGHYSFIVDDMSSEECLEQAKSAAKAAKKSLLSRFPNQKVVLDHGDNKEKNTTTLKILVPESVVERGTNEVQHKRDKAPVTLRDVVPKLQEGTPGLPLFDNSKENLVVPVTYLDHGPFSSFAPHYDSTWATLNKEESDLLLATFGGDEHCVQYIDSIRTFVSDTNDRLIGLVENILMPMTEDGSDPKSSVPEVTESVSHATMDYGSDAQGSSAEGSLDISFLDTIQNAMPPSIVQEKLSVNANLLGDLCLSQNQRLSCQPPYVLSQALGPSEQELTIATQVVSNLQELINYTAPEQLVSTTTVRAVMNGEEPRAPSANDEYDMDVLREFLMVDNMDA